MIANSQRMPEHGTFLEYNAATARHSTPSWTALSCLEKRLMSFWRLCKLEAISSRMKMEVKGLVAGESTDGARFFRLFGGMVFVLGYTLISFYRLGSF